MSDFKLPLIEPTIDYSKVPPINQKRTIAFINHFLIHTVTFLNKFSLTCEEKLFNFENKLQRVEASLEILEARLSSIPTGLENETEVSKKEEIDKKEKIDKKESEDLKPAVPVDDSINRSNNNVSIEVTKNEESDMQPIKADPNYAKYFRMMHVGVPKQALILKMDQEGLDSSALDEPNRLVPKTVSDITDDLASNAAN